MLAAYTLAVAVSPPACHITTPVLAAIGQVESGNLAGRTLDAGHRVVPEILGPVLDGHGYRAVADTDGGQWDHNTTWDRALGPMQIIPSSWRVVGVDMDGDGVRDPQNIYDSAGAAMVYLCAGGRDLSTATGLEQAILSYNDSRAYLHAVLAWKAVFDQADLSGTGAVPFVAALADAVELASSRPALRPRPGRRRPRRRRRILRRPGARTHRLDRPSPPRPRRRRPRRRPPRSHSSGTPDPTPTTPVRLRPRARARRRARARHPDARPGTRPEACPRARPDARCRCARCRPPTPRRLRRTAPRRTPTDPPTDPPVVSPETCTPPEGYMFDPDTGDLVPIPATTPTPLTLGAAASGVERATS